MKRLLEDLAKKLFGLLMDMQKRWGSTSTFSEFRKGENRGGIAGSDLRKILIQRHEIAE